MPAARRPRELRPPPRPHGDVGAVVLGGDYQGLGIVRSLGRHGVPVAVVYDERSIGRLSRYCRSCDRVADLGAERRVIDDLLRLGAQRRWQGWVLYPTRDETVAALSRNRDRLGEFFRVPTAPWEAIQWAWDKRKTHEAAAAAGVPAPRTWQPASADELDAIEAQPPWAIKEHFFYATKAKAWRADTRAELRELFERAQAIVGPGEVMVQELTGDGQQQFAYGALYRRGDPVCTMVARRRRQHPPDFGRASTYVETIDERAVGALSERLLRPIGYDGLVELEYKRDPRSGEFKLLEFNARTWGCHTIAEAGLGSQVDVVLPVRPGVQVNVRAGDRVWAGRSVLAQLGGDRCEPTGSGAGRLTSSHSAPPARLEASAGTGDRRSSRSHRGQHEHDGRNEHGQR